MKFEIWNHGVHITLHCIFKGKIRSRFLNIILGRRGVIQFTPSDTKYIIQCIHFWYEWLWRKMIKTTTDQLFLKSFISFLILSQYPHWGTNISQICVCFECKMTNNIKRIQHNNLAYCRGSQLFFMEHQRKLKT